MSNAVDSLQVRGLLTAQELNLTSGLVRQYLAQEDAAEFPVDLGAAKIWDSGQPAPATAASDDLALIAGTFATDNFYIQGRDCKVATITGYTRFEITVPPEYVAGQAFKLRFAAGMITTISDTTATIDCEVYKVGRDTHKSGSDLCTTSALNINSLTFADKDFTITPTNLAPGDKLDVRVTLAVVDGASVTAVKPTIAAFDRVLSIKG